MDKFKKEIEQKINIIIRQCEKNWNKERYGEHPYILEFNNLKKNIFSSNKLIQEKGLKGFKSFLSLRAWDDIDDTFRKNNENNDKYKNEFVDEFNNFSEFYDFLDFFVRDIERQLNV